MEKDIKKLAEEISAKLEDVKVEIHTRNEMYIVAEGKAWSMDDMLFRAMQTKMGYPLQSIATVKELERAMDANDLYVFTKRQALYTTFEYMTFVMCLGAEALNTTFAAVNEVITSIYDNGGFIVIDRKSR